MKFSQRLRNLEREEQTENGHRSQKKGQFPTHRENAVRKKRKPNTATRIPAVSVDHSHLSQGGARADVGRRLFNIIAH